MIPYNQHIVAPNEERYVLECIRSGQIGADGPFTEAASKHLETVLGTPSVMLTTSCTHALELAVLLHGLGPNDEVVLPSFTFTSTANAVTLRGCKLRFADISPDTFCMELPELEAAITSSTTAVIAMHYGGISRDIDKIAEFCKQNKLKFIEDCAHSLFGSIAGKALGRFASLSAFSFHFTKNISVGVAGAIAINDESFIRQAEILRDKGTNRAAFMRGEIGHYTWQGCGSAYAPADYVAAVLLAQLEHAEFIQTRRKAVTDIYRSRLEAEKLPLRLQQLPAHSQSAYHLFPIWLDKGMDRDTLIKNLKTAGVQCTSHYEPLHLAKAETSPRPLPVTEALCPQLIRLPLHPAINDQEAHRIVDLLTEELSTMT